MSELRSFVFHFAGRLPHGICLEELEERSVVGNEGMGPVFEALLRDERTGRSVLVRIAPSASIWRCAHRGGATRLFEEILQELDYGVARLRAPRPAFRIGLRSPKRLQFPPRAP